MRIEEMKTNHIKNPLGFDIKKAVYSWVVTETTAKQQSAARVQVARDDGFRDLLFDSGKSSGISSVGYCPPMRLEPCTRYFWRVQIWDENDDTAVSDPAWFETAKMETSWFASWITPNLPTSRHPLMRTSFFLPGEVERARAYVCGLGLYELEVNGEKVGNEYLTPGFHSYDFWLQYQTYDITSFLRKGKNGIGAMLGNGWYKGRFGFGGIDADIYGDRFALICELDIRLKDGSSVVVGTNEKWKCKESAVRFSGIYDGEKIDARMETDGWSGPDCPDAAWRDISIANISFEKLTARRSLPVLVQQRLQPVEVIVTPRRETVLDFGQNLTGWVEFECDLPAGSAVRLQFGETLQNGCFYNKNLRTAKAEMTYVSDGHRRKVRPHFTYFGFRYVKLSGFDKVSPGSFTACSLYSDMEQTGRIVTSDSRVNRLFQNALWSQKDNFLDVPTDCPQRDERMGWTGDAQVFCATACFNMDTPAFYGKFMEDLRKEQSACGGSVPNLVPCIKLKTEEEIDYLGQSGGSAAWGDAATVIPWTLYLFYGDKSLLEEQYPAMKAWADYIKRQDDGDGGSRLWKTGFHFGDWLALDNPDKESRVGGTDVYYVASAYYYFSTSLIGRAAKALCREEDAAYYSKLAAEIKEAFRNEYFTPSGRIAVDTQTARVLALFLDLVPDGYREKILKELKQKIETRGMHLDTGFVGTPYLCRVLSENGANDYAYALFLQEGFPGWLYEVKLGATTIWERWNSILPDGKVSGTGMNSLNHYAYGSIVEWMYRNMCGLNPGESRPGFKSAIIRPFPDKRIHEVAMEYRSAAGLYRISWRHESDTSICYRITIPFDAKATLLLPCGGKSEITVNGTTVLRNVETGGNNGVELDAGEYEVLCTEL